MNKEIKQKSSEDSKAEAAIKRTAKAYGTVSEEKIMKKAKEIEEVTKELIGEDIDVEAIPALTREEAIEIKKDLKHDKRLSREEQATKESLEVWSPRTKLGKDVKDGRIRNIDEILKANQKILEPEIVDYLVKLKTDLLAIGQAKGKFGGGKRRAWRQTQRKTKEGNVMTFSTLALAGDGNGHVGIGVGKAKETLPARDKATRKAKLNIMGITRGCASFDCSCSEKHSIPFEVTGKAGSARVTLIPAPQGTGLVVANELKKVLKIAGIQDVYSKTSGRQRTTFNLVKACIEALKETNREANK